MIQRAFTGMALDPENRMLKPGKTRLNLNTRLLTSEGQNAGAAESVAGNLLVTNALLPAGTNVCIGSYEHTLTDTVFTFNYNSNGNHGIYQYFPNTKAWQQVIVSSALAFDPAHKIYDVNLIDNLLFWHDDINPPRKLNINKANDTNKLFSFNIYFGSGKVNPFVNGTSWGVSITRLDNTVITNGTVYSPVGITKLSDGVKAYAAALAIAFPTWTVTENGNYLTITNAPQFNDISAVDTNNVSWAVLQNTYIRPIDEMSFEVAKYPPNHPIIPTLQKDSSINMNTISGVAWQFSYRYIYDDNEYSTLSPISIVPLDKQLNGKDMLKSKKNMILLDYSDNGKLLTKAYRNMIKRVELFARHGNTGKFQSIALLDQFELTGQYNFYNNGYYSAIDDATANELYHAVPLVVGAQDVADARLMYGDCLEGNDSIDIDMDISVQINDSPVQDTWTITGPITIFNEFFGTYDQAIYNPGGPDGPVYGASGNGALAKRFQQYLPLNGFVAYLAGTDFFGISVQDTGTYNTSFAVNITRSTFTISGVPKGTYYLRIAGNKVCTSATDLARFGSGYDLNNADLIWQRSSLPLKMIAGQTTSGGEYEWIIELGDPAPGGSIFDLSAQGYANGGYTVVSDITTGGAGEAVIGYLVEDLNHTNLALSMPGALRVEGQKVDFNNGGAIKGSAYTDHNGFYWMCSGFVSGGNEVEIAFESINSIVMRANNHSFWVGSIFNDPSTYTNSPATSPVQGFPFYVAPNNGVTETICFVTNTVDSAKLRTTIKGSVVDTNGEAYEDALVVYGQCSRFALTDADGNWAIIVYQQAWPGGQGRQGDYLVVGNLAKHLVTIQAFQDYNPGALPQVFNSTTPFLTSPASPLSVATIVPFVLTLDNLLISANKRGGLYDYGIVYLDLANRSTTVCTNQRASVYIPAQTEDLGAYFPGVYGLGTFKSGQAVISWAIKNKPPLWATHYVIVRTKNQKYNKWLQVEICDAQYVEFFDTSNTTDPLVRTTYNSSLANDIYININSINLFSEENSGSDSYFGYTFTAGDRVRILQDASGQLVKNADGNIAFFDLPIKRQWNNYIVIDALLELPNLVQGYMIEIYSPMKDVEEKIFYEIGECYEIGIDGSGRKYHKGKTQDQNLTTGAAATGTFSYGDTYYRKRNVKTIDSSPTAGSKTVHYNFYIEDPFISDFYDSQASDIGRPNVVDKDFRRLRREDIIRFGDRYIADTNINGFNAFHAANFKAFDKKNGPVIGLFMLNNTMIVVQHHEVSSIYINTQVIKDAAGAEIISLSDQVLNQINPLLKQQGCQHKGGMVRNGEQVYGWNAFKGTYWRYSGNGLTILSQVTDNISHFHNLTLTLNDPTIATVEALSVFDRRFGEAILTIKYKYQNNTTGFETIAFHEGSEDGNDNFTSTYSFNPEMYCQHGRNIVSFNAGQLWEHSQGALDNNFYGVQYNQQMTLVFADAPELIKFFKTIMIQSNNPWAVTIFVTPSDENPNGQVSELVETDFDVKEGNYYASFFMNKNTPNIADPYEALLNGEMLRGYAIVLTLVNNNTSRTVLYAVGINEGDSKLVNV